MMTITESIERLAEINFAETMISIGQDLRDERQIIVNYLKVMQIIELRENGGFVFIGENSIYNTKLYKYVFENF